MTFMELFGFFQNWKERLEEKETDPYTYGLKPHEKEIVKHAIRSNKEILKEAIRLRWQESKTRNQNSTYG